MSSRWSGTIRGLGIPRPNGTMSRTHAPPGDVTTVSQDFASERLPRPIAALASRRAEMLAWFVLLAMGVVFGVSLGSTAVPIDANLYWHTDLNDLYGVVWGENEGAFYVYPPVLAQVMVLVRPIGWAAFIAIWTVLLFGATAYAGRTWGLILVLIGVAVFPFVGFDHPLKHPLVYPLIGNIQPLLVACVVAGFRYPALWSIVLLTKIGPGVGILWFAFRREWRSLAIAIGSTVALGAVSFVLAPELWLEFVGFALRNAGTTSPTDVVPIPFSIRIVAVIALLWWGARTDRRWTVPVAAGLAAIALYHWTFVEFWMAAPVLWIMDRRSASAEPVRST